MGGGAGVPNSIDILREGLFHATRSRSPLDRAPVPGTPIGDAHLALDDVEALLQAAQEHLWMGDDEEVDRGDLQRGWRNLAAAVRNVTGDGA